MPASNYDPAQFRHKVTFHQEAAIPDGAGGSTLGLVPILTAWAVKEKPSLSYSDLLTLQAGAQVMKADIALIIRHRAGFLPDKSMQVSHNGQAYTITGISELEEPVRYIRITGKK